MATTAVSDLVKTLHQNIDSIHQTIQSLSTTTHDASLAALESSRDSEIRSLRESHAKALAALSAQREEEAREIEKKRQSEEEELQREREREWEALVRKREVEDEERKNRVRQEEEEKMRVQGVEDRRREKEREEEEKRVREGIEGEMVRIEEEMERRVEEGKRVLKELDERRKAINAQIDEALNTPAVIPELKFRSRAKTLRRAGGGSGAACPMTDVRGEKDGSVERDGVGSGQREGEEEEEIQSDSKAEYDHSPGENESVAVSDMSAGLNDNGKQEFGEKKAVCEKEDMGTAGEGEAPVEESATALSGIGTQPDVAEDGEPKISVEPKDEESAPAEEKNELTPELEETPAVHDVSETALRDLRPDTEAIAQDTPEAAEPEVNESKKANLETIEQSLEARPDREAASLKPEEEPSQSEVESPDIAPILGEASSSQLDDNSHDPQPASTDESTAPEPEIHGQSLEANPSENSEILKIEQAPSQPEVQSRDIAPIPETPFSEHAEDLSLNLQNTSAEGVEPVAGHKDVGSSQIEEAPGTNHVEDVSSGHEKMFVDEGASEEAAVNYAEHTSNETEKKPSEAPEGQPRDVAEITSASVEKQNGEEVLLRAEKPEFSEAEPVAETNREITESTIPDNSESHSTEPNVEHKEVISVPVEDTAEKATALEMETTPVEVEKSDPKDLPTENHTEEASLPAVEESEGAEEHQVTEPDHETKQTLTAEPHHGILTEQEVPAEPKSMASELHVENKEVVAEQPEQLEDPADVAAREEIARLNAELMSAAAEEEEDREESAANASEHHDVSEPAAEKGINIAEVPRDEIKSGHTEVDKDEGGSPDALPSEEAPEREHTEAARDLQHEDDTQRPSQATLDHVLVERLKEEAMHVDPSDEYPAKADDPVVVDTNAAADEPPEAILTLDESSPSPVEQAHEHGAEDDAVTELPEDTTAPVESHEFVDEASDPSTASAETEETRDTDLTDVSNGPNSHEAISKDPEHPTTTDTEEKSINETEENETAAAESHDTNDVPENSKLADAKQIDTPTSTEVNDAAAPFVEQKLVDEDPEDSTPSVSDETKATDLTVPAPVESSEIVDESPEHPAHADAEHTKALDLAETHDAALAEPNSNEVTSEHLARADDEESKTTDLVELNTAKTDNFSPEALERSAAADPSVEAMKAQETNEIEDGKPVAAISREADGVSTSSSADREATPEEKPSVDELQSTPAQQDVESDHDPEEDHHVEGFGDKAHPETEISQSPLPIINIVPSTPALELDLPNLVTLPSEAVKELEDTPALETLAEERPEPKGGESASESPALKHDLPEVDLFPAEADAEERIESKPDDNSIGNSIHDIDVGEDALEAESISLQVPQEAEEEIEENVHSSDIEHKEENDEHVEDSLSSPTEELRVASSLELPLQLNSEIDSLDDTGHQVTDVSHDQAQHIADNVDAQLSENTESRDLSENEDRVEDQSGDNETFDQATSRLPDDVSQDQGAPRDSDSVIAEHKPHAVVESNLPSSPTAVQAHLNLILAEAHEALRHDVGETEDEITSPFSVEEREVDSTSESSHPPEYDHSHFLHNDEHHAVSELHAISEESQSEYHEDETHHDQEVTDDVFSTPAYENDDILDDYGYSSSNYQTPFDDGRSEYLPESGAGTPLPFAIPEEEEHEYDFPLNRPITPTRTLKTFDFGAGPSTPRHLQEHRESLAESPATVLDADSLFDDDEDEYEQQMDARVHGQYLESREQNATSDGHAAQLKEAYVAEASSTQHDAGEAQSLSHRASGLFASLVDTMTTDLPSVRHLVNNGPAYHHLEDNSVPVYCEPTPSDLHPSDRLSRLQHQASDAGLHVRTHTADTVPSFESYAPSDDESTPVSPSEAGSSPFLEDPHVQPNIRTSWQDNTALQSSEPTDEQQDLKDQTSPLSGDFDPYNSQTYPSYISPKTSELSLRSPNNTSNSFGSRAPPPPPPRSPHRSNNPFSEPNYSSSNSPSQYHRTPPPIPGKNNRLSSLTSPFSSPSASSSPYSQNQNQHPEPHSPTTSRIPYRTNHSLVSTPPPPPPQNNPFASSSGTPSPSSIFQKTRSLFESPSSSSPPPPFSATRQRPLSNIYTVPSPEKRAQRGARPSSFVMSSGEEEGGFVPRSLDGDGRPPSPVFMLPGKSDGGRGSGEYNEEGRRESETRNRNSKTFMDGLSKLVGSGGLQDSIHNPARCQGQGQPLLARGHGDDEEGGREKWQQDSC